MRKSIQQTIAVVMGLVVVILLSTVTLPITIRSSVSPTYAIEGTLSSARSYQQTSLVPTTPGFEQPQTFDRVSTALLLNMLYMNLTQIRSSYQLSILGISSSYKMENTLTFALSLTGSQLTQYSYIALHVFIVNPWQSIAATFPSNDSLNGGQIDYYGTQDATFNVNLLLNSTQITQLSDGNFGFQYQIPNQNLSLGNWELFVFASSTFQSPSPAVAWAAATFAVTYPIKSPTSEQFTLSVAAILFELASSFWIVYGVVIWTEKRIESVPISKWNWIKEHAAIILGVILLMIFLFLRYILPLI